MHSLSGTEPPSASPLATQPAPAADEHEPFVPEDPLDWFDQAREHTPVLWHPQTASWYVTSFVDVWRLLADDRLAARSPEPFLRELTPQQRQAAAPLVDFLGRWPMFLDAPWHTDVRRILRPAFAPAEVDRLAAVISGLGGPSDVGPGQDLLDTLLRPAAAAAVGALLGVDAEQLAQLNDWSQHLMDFVGRTRLDLTAIARAEEALDRFTEFVVRTCTDAASPLATSVGAALQARTLAPLDAVAIYAQLVTGALEPTVAVLAVAAEHLAATAQLRLLYRADPHGFVNEAARLATPFHFAARRSVQELSVRGHSIPAGERVVLVLAAANRDPARFEDPFDFRPGRMAAHVAFGRGRHACLGAMTTHQIARAVLDVLLPLCTQQDGLEVAWQVGMGMRSPLHVTWRTAA